MKQFGKALGIDFGTKKTGLAMSDLGWKVAFPHKVIPTDNSLLDTIDALCKSENITAIVLGESKDFSGKENPVMNKIENFKNRIRTKTGIEVFYEPEFLTSKQARVTLDSGDQNDASAAALILQSWLDKKQNK
jgi:putative Holliday junction resolvase